MIFFRLSAVGCPLLAFGCKLQALGIEDRIFRSVRSVIWVALGVEDRIFRSLGVKYG
ncbi:MAG: hypothetical protein KA783_01740 [Chitinophagales bacterium]|nr:hypothetical protein [Chitinophagales bacterium]MBP7533139.1 hypothetical protein [Chitinophagales bacterium]